MGLYLIPIHYSTALRTYPSSLMSSGTALPEEILLAEEERDHLRILDGLTTLAASMEFKLYSKVYPSILHGRRIFEAPGISIPSPILPFTLPLPSATRIAACLGFRAKVCPCLISTRLPATLMLTPASRYFSASASVASTKVFIGYVAPKRC